MQTLPRHAHTRPQGVTQCDTCVTMCILISIQVRADRDKKAEASLLTKSMETIWQLK